MIQSTRPNELQKHPCPQCKTFTTWQNNDFKPFCSHRCKLIDLGAWANEDYKIASTENDVFSNEIRIDN